MVGLADALGEVLGELVVETDELGVADRVGVCGAAVLPDLPEACGRPAPW
ncbi:MAG TPA: hypothetical protein VN695_12065 [Streptosporangiaceae bacterium]|nr:hypothetical protein [Streptosporangiaceae bacterium]